MAIDPHQLIPLGDVPALCVLEQETLDQLREVDDGELGLAEDMLGIFEADTPPRLAALDDAIASNNLTKITEVAHAFKGACGTIGAMRTRAIAALLEAHGRGMDVDATPAELQSKLKEAFEEARAALAAYIANG
jgi:HPt (histidine-containing phosphotransfer) domain-containing protein